MKILYYSESYTSHDHRFLEAFSLGGMNIRFVTQKTSGAFSEKRPFPPRVHWTSLPTDEKGRPQKLAGILKTEQSDLLVAGPLHSCAWDAVRSGFHPWLAVSWAYDLLYLARQKKTTQSRIRMALEKADYFLCDAATVLDEARKYRGFPPGRFLQIPWGLKKTTRVPKNRAALRKSLGWEKAIVWISNRSWTPLYNPLLVLKAFAAAAKTNSTLRLVLAGDGAMKKQLHQFILRHKLSSKIHCPGYLDPEGNIQWLRMADFYLSAAACDGTSISMLEAMDCGLPVLLSDIPSNREWVKGSQSGGLFPLDRVDKLEELILQMSLLKPAIRKKIGLHNRKLVLRRANWVKNRRKLTAACQNLVGGRPS